VLVIGLVATMLALLAVTGALVRAEAARAGAQTAADLAALAAASQLVHAGGGAAAACPVAADVAGRNGARLTGCRVEGDGVVRVRTARPGGVGTATATARAGPAAARAAGAS
jgi:secretion/DNA translocation related TadE-like protein